VIKNKLYQYPALLGYNLHCLLICNIQGDEIEWLEIRIAESACKLRISKENYTKDFISKRCIDRGQKDGKLREASQSCYQDIISHLFKMGVY